MRDPRINPMPGDVLSRGNLTRTVIAYSRGEVQYLGGKRGDLKRAYWITTWQDWAKDAEVLQRGEERG
jgi:hypothetical protein